MDDLYETEEEKKEFIRTAYKNSKDLKSIINDILQLAHLQSGKGKVVYDEIEIAILFADLKLLYLPRLKEKNLKLILDYPRTKDLVINSDREKLTTILTNLIDNSIKFTVFQTRSWKGQEDH